MKPVLLKKTQQKGQGRFGKYFLTSIRRGVKITGRGYSSMDYIIKNIKKSKNLQNIVKEATIGVLAEKATLGLKIVKFEGRYFLGIEQRNLKPLKHFSKEISNSLKKELKDKNIIHGDLDFGRNIMLDKNRKPTVIDFDPERSFFVGEKTHYYSVKNLLIKGVLTNKNLLNKNKSAKIK